MRKPARATKNLTRGVRVQDARQLILQLPNVSEGRSYGLPSFLLNGRFLARFRDGDTVLVLQLATIDDRDFLMQLDPKAFFFTEHYRNYPAVLVRLADVPPALLPAVVKDAWRSRVHIAPTAVATETSCWWRRAPEGRHLTRGWTLTGARKAQRPFDAWRRRGREGSVGLCGPGEVARRSTAAR
jgi:hypothetical protein